jgi:hypothetical protein
MSPFVTEIVCRKIAGYQLHAVKTDVILLKPFNGFSAIISRVIASKSSERTWRGDELMAMGRRKSLLPIRLKRRFNGNVLISILLQGHNLR